MIRPKILLLNEPLANLVAQVRIEIRDLILGLHKSFKVTTLFVTRASHRPHRVLLQWDCHRMGQERGLSIDWMGDFSARPDLLVNDGPVSLLIGPESILLGRNELNSFRATLKKKIYIGTYTRHSIVTGSVDREVTGQSNDIPGYETAGKTRFTLPREKI